VEEAAFGVVQYAEKKGMEISGRWYEKVGGLDTGIDLEKLVRIA